MKKRVKAIVMCVLTALFFLPIMRADSAEPSKEESALIRKIVFSVLPEVIKEDEGGERKSLQDMEDNQTEDFGNVLILTLSFPIEMNDGDLTGRGMLNATRDIYAKLFSQKELEHYDLISIVGVIPMTNKYNQTEDTTVMAASLARGTAKKIKWDGLTRRQFIKIMLEDALLLIKEEFVPKR